MIFNAFFTQIVMAVLAVGIVFGYVQPTFSEIGTLQESIGKYQEENAKVADVISSLSNLVTKKNSITASDMKALLVYMPDTIDHVAISRDIFTMSQEAEIYLSSVDYSGLAEGNAVEEEVTTSNVEQVAHAFSVATEGTYEQTKLFLSMLEQNNYPLEVHELTLSSSEVGIISADMTIVTYSHN